MFFKGSRYTTVKDHTITDSEGRKINYKGIRFIPQTNGKLEYTVNEGERLDHVTFKIYKDSEQFWRICDANEVMIPDDLVKKPGNTIRIPLVK
jgi:hypothetical protein